MKEIYRKIIFLPKKYDRNFRDNQRKKKYLRIPEKIDLTKKV